MRGKYAVGTILHGICFGRPRLTRGEPRRERSRNCCVTLFVFLFYTMELSKRRARTPFSRERRLNRGAL